MGLSLAREMLAGSRLALTRLITLVENERPAATGELAELYPHTGGARIIGITGPPGAGKSTLTGKLAREFRRQGKSIGIVAVDPSSPFSGGALLGDRLRMQDLATDREIFMRSMSTRGSLGGLALTTGAVVQVLDAAGKQIILIETVGVGQAEVDIMGMADTVVVVTVPGLGDEIQINKAGIMEIGDIFVVNKADRDGADQVAQALEMMLDLSPAAAWRPPVLKTVATADAGMPELRAALDKHHEYAAGSGVLAQRRRERTRREILRLAEKQIQQKVLAAAGGRLDELTDAVEQRRLNPYQAAEAILAAADQNQNCG